jgi:hypothetical protein
MQIQSTYIAHQETGASMNPLLVIGLFLLTFVLLDVLALRHGADSRTPDGEQKNWW